MTEAEILQYIDEGANNYIRMFGMAEHMEIVHREFYSYIRPMAEVHGISFVYDLRLENLPDKKLSETIEEIEALSMPVWVDLTASDALFRAFCGKDRIHGQTVFAEDDEVYLAILPEDKTVRWVKREKIVQVKSPEQFAVWAKIANDVLAGGYPDLHPVYHYPLCERGLMNCYIAYCDEVSAAVAAIMPYGDDAASLEFVATIPEMRRKGLAKAVCETAVCAALKDGVKIITVRAANAAAGKLYQSIGFKAYNYAL